MSFNLIPNSLSYGGCHENCFLGVLAHGLFFSISIVPCDRAVSMWLKSKMFRRGVAIYEDKITFNIVLLKIICVAVQDFFTLTLK